METPCKIGISACLLGERVRYDGGHKRDALLIETLRPFATLVPLCPEAECGLGVPREAMHLIGDPAAPCLVTIQTRVDLTRRLEAWARRRVAALAGEGLAGFILKCRSPSCAITDAPILGADGTPVATGPGLFARLLMARLPQLPVADEEHLRDPARLARFLARVRQQPAP